MQRFSGFQVVSFLLLGAYILAACGGAAPETKMSTTGREVAANVVTFSGSVEAINGTEWTVNGQQLVLDPQAFADPEITVGDRVQVEARVLPDGVVVAVKVEPDAADITIFDLVSEILSMPDPRERPASDLGTVTDLGSSSEVSVPQTAGASKDSNLSGFDESPNHDANDLSSDGSGKDNASEE